MEVKLEVEMVVVIEGGDGGEDVLDDYSDRAGREAVVEDVGVR